MITPSSQTCPPSSPTGDRILLAHGEGARLSRRLIRDFVVTLLDNDFLRSMSDAAILPPIDGPVAVTTDSFVVSPLFFPGGDIGELAVHGTVNDLAVAGAEPLYLTLGLILEEGLPLETLRRVVESIRDSARACGVLVVAGDTKVVPRGAADGMFLNTTGVGRLRPGVVLGLDRVRPGDHVLISGTIGDHGLAVLAAREGLGLEPGLRSDTAPLHDLAQTLVEGGIDIHFMRDPTRGGVSAALHEIVESSGASIVLEEASLPLSRTTRGACELLGLDPLYVANEGKLLAIVAPEEADDALILMRRHPLGTMAAAIGTVTAAAPPLVLVQGPLGVTRVLDEPAGAPLPRIC